MYSLLQPSKGLAVQLSRCISSTRNKVGIQIGKRPLPVPLDTSRSLEKEENTETEQVVLSRNGHVVVCWHPETPFPYEMSKPIPESAFPTDSALKIQALQPAQELFRKKNRRLMVQELMQLTNTSKHRWLLRPIRQKRLRAYNENDETTDRDRDYL